jgi:hypothetical protein
VSSVRWYYAADAATVVEITDRVREPEPTGAGGFSVGSHADAGSGWEGDLLVDDEDGDFIPLMYRRIYAVSDDAPSGAQVIGNWFISNLSVLRGTPPVLASRIWRVRMADENSLLSRRIWTGADANRPSETDIARIRWALGETELNVLSPDETFIDTTDPVTLDPAELRDSTPEDMMMAIFQRTGKNYWIKYQEAAAVGGAIVSSSVAAASVVTTTTAHGLTTGQTAIIAGHSGSTPDINGVYIVTVTGATTYTIPVTVTVGGTGGTSSTVGRYVLCYFNPNTSSLLPSTASISNIETEVDETVVFALSGDAELDRAGGRMASGMIVQSEAGRAYVQDTTVGDEYAYVDRVSSPPVPLKTIASATAQATRELSELDIPDDEISTTIYVTGAQVNLVMHGMIVPVHVTHYPNYTDSSSLPGWADDYVNTRVVKRVVTQVAPDTFQIALNLSPMRIPPAEQFGTNTGGAEAPFEWPEAIPTPGNMLIGFLFMRGSGSADPTLLPWSTLTYGASLPGISGTDWTQVTSFPVADYPGEGEKAVCAMAWREATADDTLYIGWAGIGSGTARPRNHQMEIAGLTAGAPSVTATSSEQTTAGTTYSSPNIVVPAAGYIIAGFGYDSGGPGDWASWPGYTMTAQSPARTLTSGWCQAGFGGYSWFGYIYAPAAGTYHIELERADPPGWPHPYAANEFGWIVGFWAGPESAGYPA